MGCQTVLGQHQAVRHQQESVPCACVVLVLCCAALRCIALRCLLYRLPLSIPCLLQQDTAYNKQACQKACCTMDYAVYQVGTIRICPQLIMHGINRGCSFAHGHGHAGVVERVVVSRAGDFSCPVQCGVLFLSDCNIAQWARRPSQEDPDILRAFQVGLMLLVCLFLGLSLCTQAGVEHTELRFVPELVSGYQRQEYLAPGLTVSYCNQHGQ